MYLDFTEEQQALRKEIRNYYRSLFTPELRAALDAELHEAGGPVFRQVVGRMGADGWLGIGWPKEYGGQGRTLIEQFIFPGAVIPDGLYEVKAEHSNKCLTVFRNSTANAARLIQFECAGQGNQLWRFSPLGNGTYLVRAAHSGKCLTAGSAPTHPGRELVQDRCIVPGHNAWLLRHYGRSVYEFQVWGDGVCADVERSGMNNDANVIHYLCTRAQNQRWILTRVVD